MIVFRNNLVSAAVAAKVTHKGTNTRRYITIHETDNTNSGADADAHSRLQKNGNSRQASWHLTADDKEVVRSFPDTAICWHAGSGNSSSIAIEICVNSNGNYAGAARNAAMATAQLMKIHGIPLSNVVQHNRWTGKNCPRNLRSGARGINWTQFIAMVKDAYNGISIGGNGNTSNGLPYGRILMYGYTGNDVRRLQSDLRRLGYTLDVDGSYGNGTRNTVRQFQADNGLTVDGHSGIATQTKLHALITALDSNNTKEDDFMAQKLPKTQQDDMAALLEAAYLSGLFSVDHTKKAATMTRAEAVDLLISFVARDAIKRLINKK